MKVETALLMRVHVCIYLRMQVETLKETSVWAFALFYEGVAEP